ncbi:ABC transporter ATP-binding protein [Peribacillus simplex]|uniref:ABC transporter ATP-binding protein n=2 Tax=Peribacillus TaxID=2675229 RepID=A0AA90SZP3_9BACI|nr:MULTISPECIES: ABC transporter ATP-binding protein [Peribacillus]MDP1417464.1 ABC transporter ATP-binding protein [Peribacillus simplex]MDP1450119.1 ABC transporter ATP-binding protein [Peribacillus frigoritolerans]
MKQLLYFIKQIQNFSGKILYINLFCMIIISLLEGVGIFLLIPLIGITGILNADAEEVPFLSWINEVFLGIPETISLFLILGIYVLIMVGQSYFKRNQTILGVKIQQGFISHLREETYKSLLQANWEFYLKKRKSDIINLMANEIFRVSAGTHLFFQLLSSITFTIIQIIFAFYLSIKMTSFILFFGIILIFFSRKFVKKSQSLGKETLHLTQTYLAGITDHFNGIKDIKSNSLEITHLNWFFSLSKKMERNMVEITKVNSTSQMTFKIVSSVLIAIFMFFSIKMFMAQPAQLMLIMVIFSRLWPRFTSIQSNLEQLGSTLPSFKALLDLQNECREARELYESDYKNIKSIEIKKGLDCRHVYFRYNPNESTYALKNINVHIPSNRMTAIVGRSGAGKSTLIDLLMGLNQPDRGEVRIDDIQLTSDHLLSLRKSISYIPQDPFLFNATIRENLMIIDPEASNESIWESLEFAAAADFVSRLPQGLDTLIGDRGVRLSGGERQRLVLARAILRKPAILVLDEATSALDTENEAKIQAAIERLKGTMTIIVIAHRLSTIRNADQVLVMDQGEIIQVGEYNQLASEKRGMFSNLLGIQMESSM